MYIARDRAERLFLYYKKPKRRKNNWHIKGMPYLQLDKSSFPDLKWKDEPLEVKIEAIELCNEVWIRCTEEIYPDQEEGILIAYYVESEKEWMYFMYPECPYGWNILCRNRAYWKKLSPPNID